MTNNTLFVWIMSIGISYLTCSLIMSFVLPRAFRVDSVQHGSIFLNGQPQVGDVVCCHLSQEEGVEARHWRREDTWHR